MIVLFPCNHTQYHTTIVEFRHLVSLHIYLYINRSRLLTTATFARAYTYTYFELKHIIRYNFDPLTKILFKKKKKTHSAVRFQRYIIITNGKWSFYVKWSKMQREKSKQRVKQGSWHANTQPSFAPFYIVAVAAARKPISIENSPVLLKAVVLFE